MSIISDRLKTGIIDENPIFVQVIGMCPTLAVTSSAVNGAGMGLASTAVLIGSNVVISLLRKVIPKEIRIPAFIVIIASFVTILQFLLEGYAPALNEQLGIFIPLIVVNCLILGRAEAYASKNNVFSSIFDAIGMGLGFTISLTVLGAIREILGNGTIFDGSALALRVMPASYEPALIMVLAPGAFITLGILMAILNQRKINKRKKTN
ncbi:electron transport complex subunit RsxE [Oceanirhabdus sp. W0125-5]|uniref:electron transport complex subunit RsxE n=1 Tax=Oceanirhabdus sp. W0125-5 TaxID=2999116 RepID=UPI0022F2AA4B|nr:electron transport complex subunit E [Oceanirhabdus sp. W0125-5]WBW97161.1 electron transport complex subunit E [Oceanirhabdus sp. W0125-5]